MSILVTQDIAETSQTEAGFIEVGYISSVHGLQGEVRVNPSTGFPELRFSTVELRYIILCFLFTPESCKVKTLFFFSQEKDG